MTPAPSTAKDVSPTMYHWNEIKEHRSRGDCWIVVKGKVYDVTSWTDKHPGGDIIMTGAGRESTAMFFSYHPRLVYGMLDKYYIGDVADYETFYTYDSAFYSTCKARVDEYMRTHSLTRDSFVNYFKTALVLLAWGLSYYYGMIKGHILAVVLLGICHSQIGINIMHDGCHGSYSSNKFVCWLAGFSMDLMGASSLVWLHQHNVGHHPNCNNSDDTHKESERLNPLAFDPDTIAGSPFIRLNPTQEHRWWHRFQHIYFWILILAVLFKWTINDVRSVLRRQYSLIRFFGITQWEVARLFLTKAFFFGYMLAVPLLAQSSPAYGLFLFCVFMCITGYSFVLLFSVNHLTDETTHPHPDMEERDWAVLQVLTSSNFANDSTFWTWFSGGLNFQIEHHLFPGINHTHLSSIAPIVKRTCQEFGVKYTQFPSFWSAVYRHYSYLKAIGRPDGAFELTDGASSITTQALKKRAKTA